MVADESSTDKRLAQRIPEEIASEGAIDVVDELFAEDVVAHINPLGGVEGRDEFQELPQRMRAAFPNLQATVDQIVAEGDHVAMHVTLSGTHRGPFMGINPTEESFEIEHAIFVRFADDEIVELWGQLDAFGLLRQLGVIEAPME
ncbi:ester cyclase [Haloarcula sp. S1CR25-12]|uniref:Ester cyclase n=1 Tax=Haloarcula saliterrae TaxID=2950534 RepID=A0ABU2FFE2_9EURY|nr:ester cyclase [Haloarcula sp. S1CR25-12]MDS0260983.1 ester cyclase [Haloarcula sp. S1CR25-12]